MTGGGPDTQGGRGLTRHWPSGGGVEDGDGDYKLKLHHLHCLPRLHPWFMCGSRHRYRLP